MTTVPATGSNEATLHKTHSHASHHVSSCLACHAHRPSSFVTGQAPSPHVRSQDAHGATVQRRPFFVHLVDEEYLSAFHGRHSSPASELCSTRPRRREVGSRRLPTGL
eukprot:scaffold287_cov337-Pavlova_lutheri.AAC.166